MQEITFKVYSKVGTHPTYLIMELEIEKESANG